MFWQFESGDEDEAWSIHTGDGGGNVTVRNGLTPDIQVGAQAVSFGPLRISPWDTTTVVIDDLKFDVLDEDSIIPFLQSASGMPTQASAGAGAGAAAMTLPFVAARDDDLPDHQTPVTRRKILMAAGTGMLAAAGTTAATQPVAADDDDDNGGVDTTHYVGGFELVDAERGIQIGLDDRVEQFLPTGETYYVEIDGSVVGSFDTDGGSGRYTIGPGTTGTVRVVSRDGVQLWRRILADFRDGEPLTYTFTLDDDAADLSRGEEVVITDQPIVVDALRDAEEDGTVMSINDTTIPHTDAGSSDRGNWYLRDDTALVYESGINAPEASSVELTINASFTDTVSARLDELL